MRITQLAAAEPWLIRPDSARALLDIALRVDRLDRESIAPMVDRVEAISARSGREIPGAPSATMHPGGVAVIPIHGPIMRHAGMFDKVCGVTSVDAIDRDLSAALGSDAVRSIVLHVDSPGGMAADIGEMAAKIRLADSVKPVRAYVGNQSASAAMWLAAGAREVVASNTAMLGSIGVVVTAKDTRARDEKEGVRNVEIVSSISPRKRPDIGTDEGKAEVQAVVDRLASEFVDGIASLRGVTREHALERFGKGGMLVGRDAVEAGLADRIGSFDALVRECGGAQSKTNEGAAMPQDVTPAATESAEQIEARIRAEVEAFRAEAQAQVEAARELAVGARVEAAIARLSGKLVPAAAGHAETLLKTLARDDLADGGGRFAAFESILASGSQHGLTTELVEGERPASASDGEGDRFGLSEVDAQTDEYFKSRRRR